MLTTAISVLAAVALLSPGFVVVELSEARRARARRSDLELTLRALVYSVLVHLVFCWWTAWLLDEVTDITAARSYLAEVVAYVVVVLIAGPALLGMAIGTYLFRIERSGRMAGSLAVALGAGQSTDAFDFAFQRHQEGAWVFIELVGSTPDAPRFVGGVYGEHSAVGQSPAPHDVYLENVASVATDPDGTPYVVSFAEPPRSLYVPADQVARIILMPRDGERTVRRGKAAGGARRDARGKVRG